MRNMAPRRFHGLELRDVTEQTQVGAKEPLEIHYPWKSARLGRAEFMFCQHYKYGKLKELYIVPCQQENAKEAYLVRHGHATELIFGGFANISDPRIWQIGWCKEANGPFADLYVPENSSYLTIRSFGRGLSLDFR